MNFSNKRSIPLLVLFLLASSALLYRSTITLYPSFIHAWTQSERYAISLQFLNNGFDIFHPATFNLQTVDGITRMDLPLNEFIVAILMKILGTTSPLIFRTYTLCISIIGLIFLFLLSKKITSSVLKSWIVVLFVFLSPLYTYYQAGFVPCVPAISFVFIGYYYFYNYKTEGEKKQFYWGIFFFFLAAMIRLPFLIFLFATFLQQAYLYLKEKKFIKYEFFGFLIAFGTFIGYYRYNVHLGTVYGNMFLDTFLPAKSVSEFKEILHEICLHWLLQYFTVWHYILFFLAIFSSILAFKKSKRLENKAMWFNLFLCGGGAILYFLLMTCQYFDHDYYFLDSLFIPVVLLFLLCIRNIPAETERSKLILFAVFCVSVMFMFADSKWNQRERYSFRSWDRVEITQRNFMLADKYLDLLHIPKDAKMLVIDSYSTNIPLYMMNRKGYTVYQTCRDNAAVALLSPKWNYVVIQDIFLFSDVLRYYPIVSSLIEPIADNGKITIYKRSSQKKSKTLKEFLALDSKKIIYKASAAFESEQPDKHFQGDEILKVNELSGSTVCALDSSKEFGSSFILHANEINKCPNAKIYISVDILDQYPGSNLQLVVSVSDGKETSHYQSYKLQDYFKASENFQKEEFQFVLPPFGDANDELKIYFWNPGKGNLYYDNLEIIIYKNQ
ncbi:MAG: hypothetical protein NTX97_08505 [Bacteroidetes bacterium]|nr:hypothetical protein [Bacteroidota bacterium]